MSEIKVFCNVAKKTLWVHSSDMQVEQVANIQELWKQVLKTLKDNIPEAHFKTWFQHVYALRLDDEKTLVLGVENNFKRDWIQDKYLSQIASEVAKYSSQIKNVKIITSRRNTPPQKIHTLGKSTQNISLQLENSDRQSNLNPRFTFKEFVVAPYNEFAYSAAQAAINRLGVAYNPLFIYGNSGVGKTHLIQAIGNKILTLYPKMRVRYVTAENFTDDYVRALRNQKMEDFRKDYQNTQVLIIDDVHFFQNRTQTAVELFHLFNHLHNNNWQIIFSADCHPNIIPHIEERVRTRFSSGMIMDVSNPDRESLSIVCKKKAEIYGLTLDNDVVDYITENVNKNIREVEGILKSIALYQEIHKKPLNIVNVRQFIKNNLVPHTTVGYKDVIEKICEFYEINTNIIATKSRKKEIVIARQMIMYVMREYYDTPFSSIGKRMGKKDHTTVIHACEKIKKQLETNQSIQRDFEQIKRLLNL